MTRPPWNGHVVGGHVNTDGAFVDERLTLPAPRIQDRLAFWRLGGSFCGSRPIALSRSR